MNGVLALAALRELEALRLQGGCLESGQLIVEEVHGGFAWGGFPIKASYYAVAEGVTGVEITSAEPWRVLALGGLWYALGILSWCIPVIAGSTR